MPYWIAGIDVHKKMLAVVVADVEVEGNYQFERHKVGTSPGELRAFADWLVEREVEEVGRRWSCTGGRSAGRAKARARSPGPSTWHKRSQIVEPAAAKRTFRTQNVW